MKNNLKEFKELIKRYESVTIEEIKQTNGASFSKVINKLTGFGLHHTCTLCIAVGNVGTRLNCDSCIWVQNTGDICDENENEISYDNILDSKTPENLLKAYNNRAEYMKKILNNEK